jgi:hypothetical protein
MIRFIVSPPIKDDLDYYRNDEEIVEAVLGGQSVIAIGLRKSGKTSFLYRVMRAAEKVDRAVLYIDLLDFRRSEDRDQLSATTVDSIKCNPEAVVLLDEVDVLGTIAPEILEDLLACCRHHPVVLTCTPIFTHALGRLSPLVQSFVDDLQRHLLGGLKQNEVVALLSQSKRADRPAVAIDEINRIWQSGERLPMMLQARGKELVDQEPIAATLVGAGKRILTGLPEQLRQVLTDVAHGGAADPDSDEVQLLNALGAIAIDDDRRVTIAGPVLNRVLVGAATRPLPVTEVWSHHATILHLSDLHFGEHCIDDEESAARKQLERLRTVLEKEKIDPDFVAITGDISWAGCRREYDIATKFLDLLAEWLARQKGWDNRRTRSRFLIVPGNHDSAWCLTRGLEPEAAGEWACFGAAPFAGFINRWHREPGGPYWDVEAPYQKRCFDEPEIAFILASTASTVTEVNREGRFGEKVIRGVMELLGDAEVKRSALRIGLVHHNLAYDFAGAGVVTDAPQALSGFAGCSPGFDLVLHGHTHQGNVDRVKTPQSLPDFYYSSVGSFGVRADMRPGDDRAGRVPNELSVIRLETCRGQYRFISEFFILLRTPEGRLVWEPISGRRKVQEL